MSRKKTTAISVQPEGLIVKESMKESLQDTLRQDSIYVESKVVDLSELTGMPVRKGISKAIVSEGEIVHVISPSYGFVPNEKYFMEVERNLIEADINYATRSINRQNSSFAVDYILSDDRYHINVKNGIDKIMPMLRFTNSYDGGPCSGSFGFFRQVCQNGLHVANTQVGFKIRHKSDVLQITMPGIKDLVQVFMDNEFYSLHKKFEVLAETPILDMAEFVKHTCTKLDLFKFETSEKNPDTPSKNAELVMDIMRKESNLLGTDPNLWIGYNAFNAFLHNGGKPFQKQRQMDGEIFETILELV